MIIKSLQRSPYGWQAGRCIEVVAVCPAVRATARVDQERHHWRRNWRRLERRRSKSGNTDFLKTNKCHTTVRSNGNGEGGAGHKLGGGEEEEEGGGEDEEGEEKKEEKEEKNEEK